MCGIIVRLFEKPPSLDQVNDFRDDLSLITKRGPDNAQIVVHTNVLIGFARLSINDESSSGNQPFVYHKKGPKWTLVRLEDLPMDVRYRKSAAEGATPVAVRRAEDASIVVVCNGEIYNHLELRKQLTGDPVISDIVSNSDCEVIPHLYLKYGRKFPSRMDGVFGGIIVDSSLDAKHTFGRLMAFRDPIGVRPLYYGINPDEGYLTFSSLMLGIRNKGKSPLPSPIVHHPIGSCTLVRFGGLSGKKEAANFQVSPSVRAGRMDRCEWWDQYTYGDLETVTEPMSALLIDSAYESMKRLGRMSMESAADLYYLKLKKAVQKRMMSDRPVCALLSGGLDSTVVCEIVSNEYDDPSKLHTFAVGLPGSVDLAFAQLAADQLGTTHTNVEVSVETFLRSIPRVIMSIESYDTTTVRASVPNYIISKYIAAQTPYKVVMNGDGSDEINASYLYFCHAPSDREHFVENIKMVREIHNFDALRSDRCVAANSLESRTPFLDKELVDFVLHLPTKWKRFTPDDCSSGDPVPQSDLEGDITATGDADVKLSSYTREKCHRRPKKSKVIEKHLLRLAMKRNGSRLKPDVLFRRKEAMSDGVSSTKKTWTDIIHEYVESIVDDDTYSKRGRLFPDRTPRTKEQFYYRYVFESVFGSGALDVIPRFWLPAWNSHGKCSEDVDPSARKLDEHNSGGAEVGASE